MYFQATDKILFEISPEDFPLIQGKEWFILKGSHQNQAYIGQITRFNKGEFEFLANIIRGKKGKVTFLDGNKLNYRRENLKITPFSTQPSKRVWTKPKNPGIVWESKKWRFTIKIPFNKKFLHIGYYKTKKEALAAKLMVETVFNSLKETFHV